MATQVPDAKTWRPSGTEWYPRIHVGQHWQDRSIPIYFYLRDITPPESLTDTYVCVGWAIRPLGVPLAGKPSWITFTDPTPMIENIISWDPCLTSESKQVLANSMLWGLAKKYRAQTRFDKIAPVYNEDELEKRSQLSQQYPLSSRAEPTDREPQQCTQPILSSAHSTLKRKHTEEQENLSNSVSKKQKQELREQQSRSQRQPTSFADLNCPHCKVALPTELGYIYHISKEICRKEGYMEDTRWQCDNCLQCFARKEGLDMHKLREVCGLRKCHSRLSVAQQFPSNDLTDLTCPHCKVRLLTEAGYNFHFCKNVCLQEAKNKGSRAQCDNCFQLFSFYWGVEYHKFKRVCMGDDGTALATFLPVQSQNNTQSGECSASESATRVCKRDNISSTTPSSSQSKGDTESHESQPRPIPSDLTCRQCEATLPTLSGYCYHVSKKTCQKGIQVSPEFSQCDNCLLYFSGGVGQVNKHKRRQSCMKGDMATAKSQSSGFQQATESHRCSSSGVVSKVIINDDASSKSTSSQV